MAVWPVAVTVSVVQAVAVVSNIAIALLLIYSKQFRVGSNVLLLHLTTCNIFLSTLTLACILPVHLKNGSPEYTGACGACGMASYSLHGAIVWTVCALNYDKHSAICLPLSYNEATIRRRAIQWLLTLWSVVVAVCIGGNLLTATTYRLHSGLCLPSTSTTASRVYTGVYTLLLLVIPTTATGVFNIRILAVARQQHSRIISAIISTATINARLTVPRPELDECRLRSHRSATTATLHALAPFLLMYVPLQLLLLYRTSTGETNSYSISNGSNMVGVYDVNGDNADIANKQRNSSYEISSDTETVEASLPPTVVLVVLVLVSLSPLQALAYVFQNHGLRKVLANVMRRQLYKSAMQLEIDARARADPQRRSGRQQSLRAHLASQLPKKLQRRLSNAHLATAINASSAIANILSTTSDSDGGNRRGSHTTAATNNLKHDDAPGSTPTNTRNADEIQHLDSTTTAFHTAKDQCSGNRHSSSARIRFANHIDNSSSKLNGTSVITVTSDPCGLVRCTTRREKRPVYLNGTTNEDLSESGRDEDTCCIRLNPAATPNVEKFANITRHNMPLEDSSIAV